MTRMSYRHFRPWVTAVVVMHALGCSADRESTITVAFIGYSAAASFPPFSDFRDALAARHSALMARLVFDYVEIPADESGRIQAIEQAAARRPALILAPTANTAAVAVAAAHPVPVVFASYLDPVRAGIVTSMRSPGKQATGIALDDTLDGKRLELLQDAFPAARRVAILVDRSWAEHNDNRVRVLMEAHALGLQAAVLLAETAEEVDRLMSIESAAQFDAWYFPSTYVADLSEAVIRRHLLRLDVPGIFSSISEVARGGAMAYSQDTAFVWPALAALVARVVDGEDAGQIPIERPRVFKLAVRSNATLRGVPISAEVLRRADIVY